MASKIENIHKSSDKHKVHTRKDVHVGHGKRTRKDVQRKAYKGGHTS